MSTAEKYAGACWNQLAENESKESIAEMLIDSMRKCRALEAQNRALREALESVLECFNRCGSWPPSIYPKIRAALAATEPPKSAEPPCPHCGEAGLGCDGFGCWINGKLPTEP
jgi:hypothetical protein